MPRSGLAAAARGLAWLALTVALWLTLASGALLWLVDGFHDPRVAAWQRPYQWLVHVRAFGDDMGDSVCVVVAALAASLPFVLAGRLVLARGGALFRRPFATRRGITRGSSDNHGHASWLKPGEAAKLFPSTPSPGVGGLVVGQLGAGEAAPLLIDRCERGSTHSAVIGPPGTNKSSNLATSLLTWRKGAFVLDPSGELADMLGEELALRGQRVVRLDIGGAGPNVLSGVDMRRPGAEGELRRVAARLVGPIGDGEGARFKSWGRTIILALLLDMMANPDLAPQDKTLQVLRAGLDLGEDRVRSVLRGIADTSRNASARSLARSIWAQADVTFSGAITNATDDTEWLSSADYASLVSGDAYDMRDLCRGDTVVFCQVPQKDLQSTPGVARMIVGRHVDAVMSAEGVVDGRVLFAIDEAELVGPDPALRALLNQSRKYKCSLHLLYHSDSQVARVWGGAEARDELYETLAWRSYTGFRSLQSAKNVSEMLGTYGALATSIGANQGRSGRLLEARSASDGASSNEHEISRELMKVSELLTDLDDDERITFPAGERALRHHSAVGWKRRDTRRLLGTARHRKAEPLPSLAAE